MPRVCSVCAAPLATPAPVVCPVCSTPHWSNAKPCAAALVVRDDKLLLTRRELEPWRGLWCAPSGFCDGAEHPIAAAERESFEEAGIRISVTGYLGVWIDEYKPATPEGDDAEYVAVAYYHAVPVGTLNAAHDPREVAEVGWFAPNALPRELAPPVNGQRIYGAWREAYEAGRLTSPLPDR
jgi:8-oxo-dGTP diphosphatase